MRRSGLSVAFATLLLFGTACIYGFAGGGLPPSIKTVAVLPFDNETPQPTLQRMLYEQLSHDIQGRLGLRAAPESRANAVVRGKITSYEAEIPVSYSADPAQANQAQRKLQITVDVEIVDQVTGRTLWQRNGEREEATYSERGEVDGQKRAIQKIVDAVIAGAQSQW